MEPYELVNRAFKGLPPQELNRLLENRVDPTPLADFLARPVDNAQVKKLTRQQVRADPAFARELARAVTTPHAAPPVEVHESRKSNRTAVVMSGTAAAVVTLLAIRALRPRRAKRRNRVSS